MSDVDDAADGVPRTRLPDPDAPDPVVERRLRAALAAEAARVAPDPGALAALRRRVAATPWWRREPAAAAVALAAAAVVAVAGVGALVLGGGALGGGDDALRVAGPAPSRTGASGPPGTATATASPSPTSSPSAAPTATVPVPSPTSTVPPAPPAPSALPDLATSWPYASRAEAYAARAEAPVLLRDPVATARTFVRDVLEHPEVDAVLGTAARGPGLEVTLGRSFEGGPPVPVTRVFLVRAHTGGDAPYVVVSAAAERLLVDTPTAGAATERPIGVRGRLSGMDESVVVALRTPAGPVVGGGAADASGDAAPWAVTLDPPSALSGRVLVVASTVSAVDGGAQELVVVPATLPPA